MPAPILFLRKCFQPLLPTTSSGKKNLQHYAPMISKSLNIKQRYNMLKTRRSDDLNLEKKGRKYPRNVFDEKTTETPITIIKYAFKTEASAKAMERDNTLIFAVDVRATKPEIKEAITKLYGAKVKKVNTLISFKHYQKKAFVRFAEEGAAIEIASRAGIL